MKCLQSLASFGNLPANCLVNIRRCDCQHLPESHVKDTLRPRCLELQPDAFSGKANIDWGSFETFLSPICLRAWSKSVTLSLTAKIPSPRSLSRRAVGPEGSVARSSRMLPLSRRISFPTAPNSGSGISRSLTLPMFPYPAAALCMSLTAISSAEREEAELGFTGLGATGPWPRDAARIGSGTEG